MYIKATASEKIEEAITAVLNSMSNAEPDSDEYAKMADQLTKLFKIKEAAETLKLKNKEIDNTNNQKDVEADLKQQELNNFDRVSKETLALIAANIVGIIAVVGYERTHIIASKAFTMIRGLKK